MKKQLHIWTIFITLSTTLISCDCMQEVSGTVLDKSTRQPLDSVFAHKDSKDFGEYTDNKGEFKLNEISGGCRGCPPMNVVLTKEGYEQSTIKIQNAGHDTIYLTKKK